MGKDARAIFTQIYHDNQWQGDESCSGLGSSLVQTRTIIEALPGVLNKFGVTSLLDVPCGDFNWMSRVPLDGINYIGADLVPQLIEQNLDRYANEARSFKCLNLIEDELPKADMIFCRDCLIHLPYRQIFASIRNIRRSGAKYLMTTTFVDLKANHDIAMGDFRPLNLELAPFGFPEPVFLFNENCTEDERAYSAKSLGIWNVTARVLMPASVAMIKWKRSLWSKTAVT